MADDTTIFVNLPEATECRDWLSTQNVASFRGIEFAVEADTREGGRRIVVHEYPGSDTWDNEDMGRLRETTRVRAFVFGDDADFKAEQLFGACSEAAAAYLILPFRPSGMARCMQVQSTFEQDRMGRIAFEIEFIMEKAVRGTRINLGARPTASLSSALADRTSRARTTLQADFDKTYNSASVPAVARDAAASTITVAADQFDSTIQSLALDSNTATDGRALIQDLRDNATDYAYSGQQSSRFTPDIYVDDQKTVDSGLSTQIGAIFDNMTTIASDPALPARSIEAMFDLTEFSSNVVTDPGDAKSVVAERDLTGSIETYIQQMALLSTADVITQKDYPSQEEAVNLRSRFSNAADQQIEKATNPDVADALQDVGDSVVNFLAMRGAELPYTSYLDAANIPVAVLAYQLYDDAGKDSDILDRNVLEHPLFPTGQIAVTTPNYAD